MEIKAVKFRKDGFYSQPFAFGGEQGPAAFDPKAGIAPGTAFEDLPEDWHCPRCRRDKSKFNRA